VREREVFRGECDHCDLFVVVFREVLDVDVGVGFKGRID
jgi:hypothetical protein